MYHFSLNDNSRLSYSDGGLNLLCVGFFLRVKSQILFFLEMDIRGSHVFSVKKSLLKMAWSYSVGQEKNQILKRLKEESVF